MQTHTNGIGTGYSASCPIRSCGHRRALDMRRHGLFVPHSSIAFGRDG
jgi:hypothetical protein